MTTTFDFAAIATCREGQAVTRCAECPHLGEPGCAQLITPKQPKPSAPRRELTVDDLVRRVFEAAR